MASGPVNTTISSSSSTALTVGGDDTLTVTSTGTLSTGKKQDITWDQTTLQGSGAGVVVSNSGHIIATSGRAFDTSGPGSGESSFTLHNNASGTIIAYGNVMRDQTGNDGGSIVITNAGLIESQTDRAFNFQQDVPVISGGSTVNSFPLLSVDNTGIILSDDDTFRVTDQTPTASSISAFYNPVFTGTIAISNFGTIESIGARADGGATGAGSGQALDLNDVNAGAGGSVIVYNGSATDTTALLLATDNDAVRPGNNGTVINYGTIDGAQAAGSTDPGVQASSNGIAADIDDTITVINQAGGLIEGAKSGVFGSRDDAATTAPSISSDILVTNAGTIIGEDGKAVGADYGSVVNSGTIDGTISSSFARGDGDGVDINFTGDVTNTSTGLIEALGAKGADDNGRRNISDAISIGGGTVNNVGTIYSVGNGVTVNDDSNPDGSRSGNADLVLVNTGLIEADGGYAIRSENKAGTDETGSPSAIDYDTVTNYGTIISNGTIPGTSGTFYVETFTTQTSGGVTTYGTVYTPDPNVIGTIEGQAYTSAADAGSVRFTEGDGSAIQLGEGDDILNDYGTIIAADGRAINLEGGNNTLNLFAGADIFGTIDGGLGGTNTLNLDVPGTGAESGTLDEVIDFATLNVSGGTWTVEDAEHYAAVSIANGVELDVGNTLAITGSFYNAGSLQVNGGAELDYSAASAPQVYMDGHGGDTPVGGTVEVDGLFNAEGQTISLASDSAFSTLKDYGTIANATIVNAGGAFDVGYGLLKSDTWIGPLEIGGESNLIIQGGLTARGAGGSGPGNITIDGTDAALQFNDNETFNNANITIGAADGLNSLVANGTLVLGPDVTITTAADSSYNELSGGGALTSEGSILVSAGQFAIEPGTNFSNTGQIEVTGGELTIEPAYGFFGTFANSGVISIGAGASFFGESREIDNTGTVLVDGTSEIYTTDWGAGTTYGTFEIGALGTATFDAAVGANQDISFLGGAGEMDLAAPSAFLGTITAFTAGEKIDLSGLAGDIASFANGVLTLSHAGVVDATLTFGSGVDGADLVVVPDTHGGEYVVELVTCYCEGTRILTVRGEVPVQALKADDIVLTASGGERPITWLGKWEVDMDAHQAPSRVRPVRIAAGALGGGLPRRDLYLSPDHSLFLDGMLVPAALLLNGETIVQPARHGKMAYYHVQVEPHDVLLAEGAAAESFLDLGTSGFTKSGEEPRSWEDACAPIMLAGPALLRIRERLEEVAAHLRPATAA